MSGAAEKEGLPAYARGWDLAILKEGARTGRWSLVDAIEEFDAEVGLLQLLATAALLAHEYEPGTDLKVSHSLARDLDHLGREWAVLRSRIVAEREGGAR